MNFHSSIIFYKKGTGLFIMKAYHICYHTDEDGLASAAIIYEYLKKINKGEKVKYFFYRINYTVKLKNIIYNIPSGDELYFLDYSFSNKENFKYVLELSEQDIKVTWIDHHRTSYLISMGLEYSDIVLDNYHNLYYLIWEDFCAAHLTYAYAYYMINNKYNKSKNRLMKYYNDYSVVVPLYDIEIPLYIKYVNSWDAWKFDMPNTIEFNYGIYGKKRTPRNVFSQMFNYNSTYIDKLFTCSNDIEDIMQKYIDDVISDGKIIYKNDKIKNEYICNEYGFEFEIMDNVNKRSYKCFAVNHKGNSTMFGDLSNYYDIVSSFQFNGEQYTYSLYTSKEDIHCDQLSEMIGSVNKLGGGGHNKAAGFQTYEPVMFKNCIILINKSLFGKRYYIDIINNQ